MSNKTMDAMRAHRAALIKAENDNALAALAKHLHERIEPRFSSDIPSTRIFDGAEEFAAVFGAGNAVWKDAAHRVLAELAVGGFIEGSGRDSYLTRRGFEEFTRRN